MSKSAFRFAAFAAGASLALATAAQAVVITIEDASGNAGDTVPVNVTLTTEGSSVAGTENAIGFGGGIAVAAKAQGTRMVPDCAVNPDIDKGGTAFSFQPNGCTPGTDCTGVKALVLSLSNVDPIPDGSTLYTCQIAIAADATQGDHALNNTGAGSSDPDGNALTTTGVSGNVSVGGTPSGTVIKIGDADGIKGGSVGVEVSLTTDASIAGTENVISFAAPIAIAAKTQVTRMVPDCAVNEAIDKGGTAFSFQPNGCTPGTDCTGVKALVLSLSNVDPIPTGSVLYTCQVTTAEDAADGDYPLTCSGAGASDPDGNPVTADCTNGTIHVGGVVEPTNTPTETPTEGVTTPTNTPVATATNTTGATATHTRRPTNTPGGGGNDDDGCAVVAPAQSSAAWMLLLPAAALLWLRRRSR